MFAGKTIFVSSLDWGMGHATRCVPVIRQLLEENRVILGVCAETEKVFRAFFPDLVYVKVPGYKVSYSASLPAWMSVLAQIPRLNAVIDNEHRLLRKLVVEHGIDVVISDNRYGMYHESVHSVFICHQVNVRAGLFSNVASYFNHRAINRFSELWIPDFASPDKCLAGELSDLKGITIPARYIGALSALQRVETNSIQYDYLVLLSGAEPQRTVLEKFLLKTFAAHSGKIAFVRGSAKTLSELVPSHITIFDTVFGAELAKLVASSRTVICRSGYSTLMDMLLLGVTEMILIPTPGQTEQEYLSAYWKKKFGVDSVEQKNVKRYFKTRLHPAQ